MNATATLRPSCTVHGHTLTRLQVGFLAGGLVAVAIVCLAIAAPLDESALRWVKSGSAVLLFVAAFARRPAHRLLGWVVAALGVSALGDLFMTGILVLPAGLTKLAGMGCFLVAYALLTVAFWHGRRLRGPDVAWLAPYLVAGGALIAVLWPHLGGVMAVAVPVFTAGIVTMAWAAALTTRRGVYTHDVAVWFAAAAAILVASDAAVAFVMFDPPPAAASVSVDVWIRLTYLVGWLLLLLAVVDPRPVHPGALDAAAPSRQVAA